MLVAGAALLRSGAGLANPPSDADTFFQQGVEARDRGDFAVAYDRFAASLALDNATGTLLNMALCEEKLARLLSARAHLEEVLRRLPPNEERVPIARERLAAILARTPRLVIQLDPSAPPGARVSLDGAELPAASLGAERPMDPGTHTVIVVAPDRMDQRASRVVAEGEVSTWIVGPGEPSAPARPQPPPQPPTQPDVKPSARRPIGFAVGGVGLAGVAVGAVTGGLVLQAKSDVNASCDLNTQMCASQDGIDAARRGRTLSNVSTVSFIAGLAGVGVGVALVLTAKHPSKPSAAARVWMLPDGGGAAGLSGSF